MRKRFWLVFSLVFTWKIALYIFTAQPVPANDSFFYDGAVIHHLLHGGYYNPCIALAFPISGAEIFSAYPPGYQLPLLLWMSVFGTSALSAMALQLTFFGLYLVALLLILRRLQIPPWCVNVAGVFLLSLSFHDRPDGCAHVLGMFAVYCCIRSRKIFGGTGATGLWTWLMLLLIVLAICTSLQIGTTYFGLIFIATLAASYFGKEPVPLISLALMVVIPVMLVLLVKAALPQAWAGFMENVHQTPFIIGFHKPRFGEVAKILRSVPGLLLVAALLVMSWFKQHYDFESDTGRREEIILLAALLPALGIVVASVSVISPNTVGIPNYLQPLIVACYLALTVSLRVSETWRRWQVILLIPAMLLVSARSFGMTTWGVVCARDFGYRDSLRRVETELAGQPHGAKVVMSAAFLYGAAAHDDVQFIHSDWMARADGDSLYSDTAALVALKPKKIILTQYDYFRRYQEVLKKAKMDPSLKNIEIENAARVRSPDSYEALQKVVQHISWAPVIVTLTWQDVK